MWEIHDNFGAPQCGCSITECYAWYEVEEYFEDCEAMERLEMGYATIIEVDIFAELERAINELVTGSKR